MTPEEVLLEAIAAASLHGDTPDLRRMMCRKLNFALQPFVIATNGDGNDQRKNA
jgi:hypothetical protein